MAIFILTTIVFAVMAFGNWDSFHNASMKCAKLEKRCAELEKQLAAKGS